LYFSILYAGIRVRLKGENEDCFSAFENIFLILYPYFGRAMDLFKIFK